MSRSQGSEEKRPLLATGRVVGDYETLLRYVELARERGLKPEDYTLTREDVEYAMRIFEERRSLLEVIDALKRKFAARLDCRLASEAMRLSKGVVVPENQACDYVSSLYAGWLVEACETLGLVRLREGWR